MPETNAAQAQGLHLTKTARYFQTPNLPGFSSLWSHRRFFPPRPRKTEKENAETIPPPPQRKTTDGVGGVGTGPPTTLHHRMDKDLRLTRNPRFCSPNNRASLTPPPSHTHKTQG